MAYDPNFPPDHQTLNAAPFRTQFAGLNDNINNVAIQVNNMMTPDDITDAIGTLSASNVNTVQTLTLTISNPPTQAQVQAILAKLNDLINGLHR